jgi:hypothetical protein
MLRSRLRLIACTTRSRTCGKRIFRAKPFRPRRPRPLRELRGSQTLGGFLGGSASSPYACATANARRTGRYERQYSTASF